MKILKRVHNMSDLELQDLQEAVLTEIHRRKAIESGEPMPATVPLAAPDLPLTLPIPDRRVSRNPRRLRRAA